MNLTLIGYGILILAVTLASGYADSRGFLYSAAIWTNGQLSWEALAKAGVSFGFGIALYWIALRFLPLVNLALSPEVQTLGWFVVTISGVAISSGEFFKWQTIDQAVGVGILVGMGWLLFRGH